MENQSPSQSEEIQECDELQKEDSSNYNHEGMSEVICSNLESQCPSQSQENEELEALQKEVPSVTSEATSSNLESHCPPQSQERQEHEALHKEAPSGYKPEDFPASSSKWKISTVILVFICLALLSFVGFLTTILYPDLFNAEVHPGNTSYTKEVNETVNQDSFNAESYPGNNSYSNKENKTAWKYLTCKTGWHQHGENCYFFKIKKVPWKECDGVCTALDSESRFLKVDTEDEMNFIIKLSKMLCDVQKENIFISLYYNSTQGKWVWLDGTDFTLDKSQIQERNNTDNKCILVKYGQIIAEDCQSNGSCICKKTLHYDHINT